MKHLLLFLYICFYIQVNSLDLEKIRADILNNHNYHRKRHQVESLVRNEDIENMAQEHSEYLAEIRSLKNSGNNNYGENLYYCISDAEICLNGEEISENWYSEVNDYDFNNPGYNSKTSHFTQLVWKGSKQIGCGVACNKQKECFVTCNYNPSGNYLGQFSNNVLPFKESEIEDENVEEKEEENVEENVEEKVEENVEENGDENLEENGDEKVEEKKDQNVEEKKDQSVEEKVEEKVEENVEEKVEEKVEENVEENGDENLEENGDENLEGNGDKNGMNGITKFFLALFIIILIIIIIFLVFHFVINKKKIIELRNYFIK